MPFAQARSCKRKFLRFRRSWNPPKPEKKLATWNVDVARHSPKGLDTQGLVVFLQRTPASGVSVVNKQIDVCRYNLP